MSNNSYKTKKYYESKPFRNLRNTLIEPKIVLTIISFSDLTSKRAMKYTQKLKKSEDLEKEAAPLCNSNPLYVKISIILRTLITNSTLFCYNVARLLAKRNCR